MPAFLPSFMVDHGVGVVTVRKKQRRLSVNIKRMREETWDSTHLCFIDEQMGRKNLCSIIKRINQVGGGLGFVCNLVRGPRTANPSLIWAGCSVVNVPGCGSWDLYWEDF